MARLFSFASWNIEHFAGKPERFDRVVDVLNASGPPDVFGIYEVQSSTTVLNEFVGRIPSHQFFITKTEGSPIDTLVGVSRNFTSYYEQRNELAGGMPSLRPGASVTLRINGRNYTLLFVHLKAFDVPIAWGLRDDMVYHIRQLKTKLDSNDGEDANFIAMGDYNAVGLNVTYMNNDMNAADELARYEKVLGVRKMKLVPKDHNVTLYNGSGSSYPPADADHVFASNHLDIRRSADVNGVTTPNSGVNVRGWPELATPAEQDQWIAELSDHALLYGEVHE